MQLLHRFIFKAKSVWTEWREPVQEDGSVSPSSLFFDFLSRVCSEPRGSVRNLQVYDPTTSKLNVRWEPAEGNVREYIVRWAPSAGGEASVVRP